MPLEGRTASVYPTFRERPPSGHLPLRVRSGAGHYTYWDYFGGAFDHNHGLRIDHHLLTPQAADLLREAWIEVDPRTKPKPSDHTPVWVELDA